MTKVNYSIKVRCWKDEYTGQWLIYSKKLDISAYGETKKKARQMFEKSLTELLMHSIPRFENQ